MGSGGTALLKTFLTLTLDKGESKPSRAGSFTPEETALEPHRKPDGPQRRSGHSRVEEKKPLKRSRMQPRPSSPYEQSAR
jgi:hypothetical protein